MATIYVETSIVSYLTARPSNNLIAAAWQKETTDWWEKERSRFSLYVSQVVIEEAQRGDRIAAIKRLEAIEGIPLLPVNEDVLRLSNLLIAEGGIPEKALDDALHISIAAVHNIDFLLTWNCKHINNAEKKPIIRRICANYNVSYPEIATPIELMGVN